MPEDVIRIMCPKLTCRRILAVPETARGRTVRCRGCGSNIRIPTKPVKPAADAAAPPNNGGNSGNGEQRRSA